MTSTVIRNRVLLASQSLTALVAVSVNLMGFWLIPKRWQLYLWASAAILIGIFLPLLLWLLPKSPRWLEGKGVEEAEREMARLEQRGRRAGMRNCPSPSKAAIRC